MGRFGAGRRGGLLAAVCIARLALFKASRQQGGRRGYLELVSAGGAAGGRGFLVREPWAVFYYPVLVNAILLAVFAASLWRPPTVIERIARLREPDLPPAAVVYTRRVTIVWSVFFALNGAAALLHGAVHVVRDLGALQRPHCLSPDRRALPRRARDSFRVQGEAEAVTANRFAALLAGHESHRVFRPRRQGARGRGLAAAAGVAARLRALDGERWALNLDDASTSPRRCSGAGPPAGPRSGAAAAACDAGRVQRSTASSNPPAIRPRRPPSRLGGASKLVPTARRDRAVAAALVLYTSGSTGAPKAAGRRLFNIEAELTAFEAAWARRSRRAARLRDGLAIVTSTACCSVFFGRCCRDAHSRPSTANIRSSCSARR